MRWLAISLLAFQLVNGIARIPAAGRPDGIHYARPYPAIQNPGLKQDLGWYMGDLAAYLSPKTKVLLEPMDPWVQAHLMVYLFSRHIPFAVAPEVIANFGAGRTVGWLPIPWKYDVRITIEKNTFVLCSPVEIRFVCLPVTT